MSIFSYIHLTYQLYFDLLFDVFHMVPPHEAPFWSYYVPHGIRVNLDQDPMKIVFPHWLDLH